MSAPAHTTKPTLRVLGLLFPNFDILDLTGSIEVFGNSSPKPNLSHCHIDLASATDSTSSSEGVSLERDLSFIDLLAKQADGTIELEKYDILLVPGAIPEHIVKAIEQNDVGGGVVRVVKAFAELQPQQQQQPQQGEKKKRYLLSVCTGAGFLGAAGLLAGRTATTHWSWFDGLREVCTRAGGDAVDVVEKRWVVAGQTAAGVKLLTAGGVSCGIDAALWILSELAGMQYALRIAKGMDYEWRFGPAVGQVKTTDGYVVD